MAESDTVACMSFCLLSLWVFFLSHLLAFIKSPASLNLLEVILQFRRRKLMLSVSFTSFRANVYSRYIYSNSYLEEEDILSWAHTHTHAHTHTRTHTQTEHTHIHQTKYTHTHTHSHTSHARTHTHCRVACTDTPPNIIIVMDG